MDEAENTKTALAIFMPSGKRGEFPIGTPILQCARSLGVDIDSVCGGRAICGRCQIEIGNGVFAKHNVTSAADHVSECGPAEARYREKRGLGAGRRLSCQSQLLDDVVIDVPAESQLHRQVIRKEADDRAIEIDPIVRLHYVQVEQPDMHNPLSDDERMRRALADQWDLKITRVDLPVLRTLQPTLREGSWSTTVAVYNATEVIAVYPGFVERVLGCAIDMGSTTIAVHLCDLSTGEVLASSGCMNPQIRFGEDLMSRVSYVMMNENSTQELTNSICGGIDQAINEALAQVEGDASHVVSLTLAGNPVMHHLLLGIDPRELGAAPFALASGRGMTFNADEIGLRAVLPTARCYILPCIAGHVGADAAAVALAEAPQNDDEITLIVDVGTNAELILGNSQRLLAASSPTGPAFEGAQISAGQRAAPGAIERVRIDPDSLEPRVKVIGCGLWSDEAGFDKATEGIGVTGICGSGIIEVVAELYLASAMNQDGIIKGECATRSSRIVPDGRTFNYVLHRSGSGDADIVVTQADIRAIQLAKAALNAGAQLLMAEYGTDHVNKVSLAGAFGAHIDTKHAMVLGMIPDCALHAVRGAGNAAGTGARIALLNRSSRKELEDLVMRIEKIETAVEPRFQEFFVDSLAIPHKSLPYEKLRSQIDMPAMEASGGDKAVSGRRRRNRR